jgi:hypothetical protein
MHTPFPRLVKERIGAGTSCGVGAVCTTTRHVTREQWQGNWIGDGVIVGSGARRFFRWGCSVPATTLGMTRDQALRVEAVAAEPLCLYRLDDSVRLWEQWLLLFSLLLSWLPRQLLALVVPLSMTKLRHGCS